jgi:two-component system cell cycle response regulator DivK
MSLTILIIEDTPANTRLFTVILTAAGYQVLATTTALEGIAMARTAQPDLILMDIQLPTMNGLEATTLLKADPLTSGIPIIAVTAFAMKGDEEKIRAAGCDDYLSKPVHHQVLLQAVNRALDAPKQTTEK